MFARRPLGPLASRNPKLTKKKSRKDLGGPPLVLDRVLGLTVNKTSAISLHPDPENIILAYPAGGMVVLHDVIRNKQTFLLAKSSNDADKAGSGKKGAQSSGAKSVSCVAFSHDGEHLAVGEAGHQPRVLIYRGNTVVAVLEGHQYGIQAVVFSPDGKYLVSVGYQHDNCICVWNWRLKTCLANEKVTTKINAVAYDPRGDFFVTAGVGNHLRQWKLIKVKSQGSKYPQSLESKAIDTTYPKNTSWVDVACAAGSDGSTWTYSVAEHGVMFVCDESTDRRFWSDLKSGGRAVAACNRFMLWGCTDGAVRMFEPDAETGVHHLGPLPKPHSLYVNLQSTAEPSVAEDFPDLVAIKVDAQGEKVVCVYNDRSLYIFDTKDITSDLKLTKKYRSFLFHSDTVWGVEMVPAPSAETSVQGLPENTFVTYSSDGTVRFWNLDAGPPADATEAEKDAGLLRNRFFRYNLYSDELLRILYLDREGIAKLKSRKQAGSPEPISPDKTGIRALRISSDGKRMASGDRQGNVRVHELHHFQELVKVDAHEGETLAIDLSDANKPGHLLMATAGRDRLLHVFDCDKDYDLLQTLDDHTSSITSIRFGGADNRLISCAADKTIIFRLAGEGKKYQSYHHVTGRTSTYDMDVDATSKYLATVAQDRLNIFSINSGKSIKSFQPGGDDATADVSFIKISLDPSGLYAAVTAADKMIRIFEFYSGTCLGRVPSGHSELITGIKFSLDCKYIISTAADGCVFVWRIAPPLVQQMQARLGIPDTKERSVSRWSSYSELAASSAGSETSSLRPSQTAPNDIRQPLPFAYSEDRLPAWARSTKEQEPAPLPERIVIPRGRWAQRVGQEGVRLYSELPEMSPPVARIDEQRDRRYTLEPPESPLSRPPAFEDAAVFKITDVMTEPEPMRVNPRRGADAEDMVVEDLDSVISTSELAGQNDLDVQDDDDLEEPAIFLPPGDYDDTTAQLSGLRVIRPEGVNPAEVGIETGDADLQMMEDTNMSNAGVKGIASRSEIDLEYLSSNKEFGNMTYDEYMQQPPAEPASPDTRSSMSARHIASRKGSVSFVPGMHPVDGASQERKDTLPIFVEVPESAPEPEKLPADIVVQEQLVAGSLSLGQQKEVLAQDLEQVREKLVALERDSQSMNGTPTIENESQDMLEASNIFLGEKVMDQSEPGSISDEGEILQETKIDEKGGVEEQDVADSAIEERYSSQKMKEDVHKAVDASIPIPDAAAEEEGEAVQEAEKGGSAVEPEATVSEEMTEKPHDGHHEHVSDKSVSRSHSPYRARSVSPVQSAVNRDVVIESASHAQPTESVAPDNGDVDAAESVESTALSNNQEQHEQGEPSITLAELNLLRELADRASQVLVNLVSRELSEKEQAMADELQDTLHYVQSSAKNALGNDQMQSAGTDRREDLFQGSEMIATLEKYSNILVDMVRQKLRD